MKMTVVYLSLFLPFSGYSQSAIQDTSVNCITYWKLGETKSYSIIHEKSNVNEAGHVVPFKFEYLATVSVIDSTSDSYTIKWRFQFPKEYKLMHPHSSDSLPVFNGMQMIFKVSEMGTFMELLNWEEVRDTYVRQMDMSMPKNMDSTTAAMYAATKKMFSSKQIVEATFIKEIQLFHEPFGYKFTTTSYSEKTQIDNPFGGQPFPATQIYKLTKLDKEKDSFTLVLQLNVDKVEKSKSYDLQDFCEYHIVNSTGWISRMFYKRSVSMGKFLQSDSFSIMVW